MKYNIAHDLYIEIADDWDVESDTIDSVVSNFQNIFTQMPNDVYVIELMIPDNFHIFKYSQQLQTLLNYLRSYISSIPDTENIVLVGAQFKIVSDRVDKVQYITSLTETLFEDTLINETSDTVVNTDVEELLKQIQQCIQVAQRPHIILPQ